MKIRLLTIADRPPRKFIKEIIAESKVDIIVTLGDLEFHQISELSDIANLPKIGVYGNHDSGTYMNDLGIINMHLNRYSFRDITFGGFEGCVRYKESDYAKMYSQEESIELLRDFPNVDVLLTHSPPRGIHDHTDPAHVGLEGIINYIKEKKPKYLLHGHTYIPASEKRVNFGDTEIIHISGDEIIELEF